MDKADAKHMVVLGKQRGKLLEHGFALDELSISMSKGG
jgi:hypothetical protein